MYSLKYGTVPVVRATGGLDDTVEDFNPSTQTGNGFKFVEYSGESMLMAVKRAVDTFGDKTLWKRIIKNGMQKDFSWEVSARKYLHLYRKLSAS
jgi:starch synthase